MPCWADRARGSFGPVPTARTVKQGISVCAMIRKAFKYRLYPNEEQKTLLAKHFGCVRWVYNWTIDYQQEAYENGDGFQSAYTVCKELPKLKRQEETEWLAEVNAQALQAAVHNACDAFKRFFEGAGYPRFKSKHARQSFHAPQRGRVDFDAGRVSVPKIKDIPARVNRRFEGKIKTVTISQNRSGKYYASVLVEVDEDVPEKPPVNPETTVGVDLGLTHFATLSNGEKVDNPRYLQDSLERLAVLQKRLARKKKGSSNYAKQRRKVARLHEHIANQREDFLHKLTRRLTDENQTVAIETLNVSGMMKNRCLSRAISDVGWHKFKRFLEYKSDWYGVNLIKIGRFQPSTRRCMECGHVNGALTLSDRQWTCPACGHEIEDRDLHAARQIKHIALTQHADLDSVTLEKAEVESNNTAGATERACGDAPSVPGGQLTLFGRGKAVAEAGST